MKKKHVVFFYPDSGNEYIHKHLPLAPIKLGSQLLPEGFGVEIVDGRVDKNYQQKFESSLKDALFLGVSVMTGKPIRQALKASSFAKKMNKDLPVVWGGWHPTVLPAQTVRNENIDVVAIGQGERIIAELANAFWENKPLKNVRGIAYKDTEGNVLENEPMPFLDVNSFKSVDFSLVDINKYAHDLYLGKRTIAWNTSQGCPYSCAFCSTPRIFNRRWSGLKADTVIDEIEILVNRMGVDGISFTEDNFMVDLNRVRKICEEIIKRKIRLKWAMDLRVDQTLRLSDEYLELMKKSGCTKVFLGAESGDQEVLDFVNKGITVEGTHEAVRRFNEHGIIAELLSMVGFPLNPKRDLMKTVKLIRDIKSKYPNHQATTYLFTPLPGTRLFDIAVQKGLDKPEKLEDWMDYSALSVVTPWVDKKYLETLNMFVKFYIPFAYPSEYLKGMFKHRIFGFWYKMLHKLALFRMKRNFFKFPIEWIIIKFLYYNIKVRYNMLKGAKAPR